MPIAVIGGTGIAAMTDLTDVRDETVETRFGTAHVTRGSWRGRELVFLHRHGPQRNVPPHRINYRANIAALKQLGVTAIFATTAVGGLHDDWHPGTLVLLDQFLDFTKSRPTTFFDLPQPLLAKEGSSGDSPPSQEGSGGGSPSSQEGSRRDDPLSQEGRRGDDPSSQQGSEGGDPSSQRGSEGGGFLGQGGRELPVHIDMTAPYCPRLRRLLLNVAEQMNLALIPQGVYACMEGPRFETPAEIRMLRMLGGDVVGMTGVPEVVLAREAGMCYAGVSIVTNYAAGISPNPLTHQEVLEAMAEHAPKLLRLFLAASEAYADEDCPCRHTLFEP
ncbi:MAG: MTAP family purine nucleoside phosphorylase [Abditibacteriales bacterium]|nr:MTAP family purine nucleoside phosphorylase [Abditibacteriales bacterium]